MEDAYGDAFESLTADAPVWLSYARNNLRGDPLGTQGIAKMCEKRLGVSKSHVLRHAFAHNMETAGAKVSEILARFGDASITATTGKYLVALRADEYPYGDTLASMFGVE